jgi:hypothetical protein
MKAAELITFIQSRVAHVYYANRFPVNAADDCAAVKLTSGFPIDEWSNITRPSFQVRVRGASDKEAATEAKAYEIHAALTNLRDVTIGDDSVVVIRAMNSAPPYLGVDANERPIYSMNFNTTVEPRSFR